MNNIIKNVKITNGPLEVLESGTIIFDYKNELKFQLSDGNGYINIVFIFTGVGNEEVSSPSIKTNIKEDTLFVDVINYSMISPVHGLINQAKLGDFNNRHLYFSFRTSHFSSDLLPTLFYTFYLGEEVQNGN